MNIKQIPEDFIVTEIIDLNTNPKGDYTYFWLTKKNWTTMRAVQEIAKQCQVSFKRFKFAGIKDRAAITKQAVSAFKVESQVLENVKLKDIKIEIIGKGNAPISLGTLAGNKFEITVRNLPKKFKLKKITKFPNFFGEQRFGYGNTALIGKEIIKGNLELAVKYLLTFSEIKNKEAQKARAFAKKNWGNWKEVLNKFPKFLSLEKAVLEWLTKYPNDFAGALRKVPKPIRKLYVYAYQSLLFNKALEKWSKKHKENKQLVVPGYKTKLKNDEFSKHIISILKKEAIDLAKFKCQTMPELAAPGIRRSAFIIIKELKSSSLESDELNKNKKKLKLEFELPKNTYATTLLNVLFKHGKT